MSGMKDQFFDDTPYPESPGFKEPTTSREAARSMAPEARKLRGIVLRLIDESPGGLTADQAAEILGESVLAVRPRFSELRRTGHIIDSGHTAKNKSGKSAIIWIKSR